MTDNLLVSVELVQIDRTPGRGASDYGHTKAGKLTSYPAKQHRR